MESRASQRDAWRRRIRKMTFKYLRRPLKEYRWHIIGLLAVLALVLGWWGFDRHLDTREDSFWDKLYKSLQQFTLQSEVSSPLPIQLELSRWIALAVAVAATVGALLAILREHVGRLRVRFARNHVLVCGLGRCGARLAVRFRDRGYQVVAIDRDAMAPGVDVSRREGAIVLQGDATDPAVLRQAGIDRARYVVVACGDDGSNLDVVVSAHELTVLGRRSPLDCFAHITEPELRRFVREFAIRLPMAQIFRLSPFAVSELGTPVLLAEYPPFDEYGRTDVGTPHIVVVGAGQTGRRILLGVAELWMTLGDDSTEQARVTVIDKFAGEITEALGSRHAGLAKLLDVRPLTLDVDSPMFPEVLGDLDDATGMYICLDEEPRGLRTALILRRAFPDTRIPIVVRTLDRPRESTFPLGLGSSQVNIGVFRMFERACIPEILLRGTNEVLARAIHDDYLRAERAKGEDSLVDGSKVEWDALSADLQESNRDQAAHIGLKLRQIACDITSINELDPVVPFKFTREELERLAELEHERWMAERRGAGFVFAETKDLERKKSLFLVPWEELPEETKEQDRNTVRGLPAFVARAGFRIIRTDGAIGLDQPRPVDPVPRAG